MSDEDVSLTAPRAPTAAEKRAARRARVLAGGERRLKLLTGQIDSLQPENDAVEKAMDEGVAELLEATDLPSTTKEIDTETTEKTATKFPPRVDPAQRRRDAQARRQKKEAMVREILSGNGTASASSDTTPPSMASVDGADADTVSSVRKELSTTPEMTVEPAYSRHALALRIRTVEEKLILLVIVGAALYLAFATDLQNITTDLLTTNPLFLSYQQLVANGVSLESIRQQMQRENLEPALMEQMERVFVSQRKSESASASSASFGSSFIPNIPNLLGFLASWVYQPPIIFCVLLLRVLFGIVGGVLHTVLKLPEVANPQDDDMGFIGNLALASRPALKGYISKARKSVDDVFLFLWSFILAVAAGAIAAAHAG